MLSLALAACVEGREVDELGTAHYGQGAVIRSADYGPGPGAVGPAGGADSLVPSAGSPAGAGPQVTPPGSVPVTGGTGGAPTAGAGAAGAAGMTVAGAGGADATGVAGAAGESGTTPPSTSPGTLTIAFTSVNQRGRYAPRNVGAVWIETSSGMFVKTIERWAGIRANHLEHWESVSGGWPPAFFGGGGSSMDQMDAVSRATLRTHEMHSLTWDMKGLDGQVVPDGTYKVGIEVTEDETTPGAWKVVEFVKGSAAQTVMPPDAPPFSKLTISYAP